MASERDRLSKAVDDFAVEMKRKLMLKMSAGLTGWDGEWFIEGGRCERNLFERVHRLAHGEPQEIDIANLAMFLWHHRRQQEKSNGG